ncbi:MAG: tandem-95 repeat protein [Candidatus Nealsonbacteria bacterium]|nr:tandem-95 repeat protein [Candidatus Nealsonbacteria bacterium]
MLDGTGVISGTVYEDLDLSGSRDPGETGLAGWEVELQRLGGDGQLRQTFRDPGQGGNEFGRIVATLDDKVLVSSYRDDTHGSNAGAVHLFDPATGNLLRTFHNPTPDTDDRFGRGLSAGGGHVLVGAYLDDEMEEDAGAAYLFDAATGELLQTFHSPYPDENDQFGRSVAMVGANVLVGARFDDGAGQNAGAVYLFDGASGALLDAMQSPNPTSGGEFGYCVAAMGDKLLVAARNEGPGTVYLFDSDTGNLLRTFVNPSSFGSSDFGHSVAVVGDNVLVGARRDLTGGAVYLFDGMTGDLLHTFQSPAPIEGGEFGFSVAAMGDDVLIGARYDHGETGAAYLFDGATGVLLQTFANPVPNHWDRFGTAVAAIGNQVVVGTQNSNVAYLFDVFSDISLTITNDDGDYTFADVAPGPYLVCEVVQPGFVRTSLDGNGAHLIDVPADGNVTDIDFGNVRDEGPIARDDAWSIAEDTALLVAAPGLLVNDYDPEGNPLTASRVFGPYRGELTLLSDGSFTYTPNENFHGTDSFTYLADDGLTKSNVATVTITIDPVNDAPVAADNWLAVQIDTLRTVPAPGVLGNDTDADGDAMTVSMIASALHGLVALEHDGSFSYRPETGYVGPDRFTYQANDGKADSNVATVEITVGSDVSDRVQEHLVITEVHYNPAPPTPEELAVDSGFRNSDFEFIELQNVGSLSLELGHTRFTGGVDFTFPNHVLAPGQQLVVVRNSAAFEARYGSRVDVAGVYDGYLHGSGERIALTDQFGYTFFEFYYDDVREWPGRADGKGASLELINPAAVPLSAIERTQFLERGQTWRSSIAYGGTPGADPQPHQGIVINEVLSHTDWPMSDSIELHNTTDQPVDVGGWYLSDEWGWDPAFTVGNYKRFRIPSDAPTETTIPPGGYKVFDELGFNPTPLVPLPNHFTLAGNHGDNVWLMKADGVGNLTHFGDHVQFGAQANAESWGRWPDGSGVLYPMTQLTLDGPNSGPRLGSVIISEVHYHPIDANPGDAFDADDMEFVEIYNTTGAAVTLTDWRLRSGVDFDFVDGDSIAAHSAMVIVPFDPLVIPELLAEFQTTYNVPGPIEIRGPYSGQLRDDGERVQLQYPNEPPIDEPDFHPALLEDEVTYDDESPWPTDADGNGRSLSRLRMAAWGNDAANWIAAVPTPGLTQFDPYVAGRYVFYNDAAATPEDDDAIATDKRALLPGGIGGFANYTSYALGINGIMVDLANLSAGATPGAGDCQFRFGNDDTPGDWPMVVPENVAVEPGAGGSARATITFESGELRNGWLQVKVAADALGLSDDDVFYFGNAVAEAGNSTTEARVTTADLLLARNNPRDSISSPAGITFPYDYDRDGQVDATDVLLARNNQTNFLSDLKLIDLTDVAEEAEEPPRANLAWLTDLDQPGTQRPAQKDAAAGAVDLLLATLWT